MINHILDKGTDAVMGEALSAEDADLLGLSKSSKARLKKSYSNQNPWRGASKRRRKDLISSVSGCGGSYRPSISRGSPAALLYIIRALNGTVIESTSHVGEANVVVGTGQVSQQIDAHLIGLCKGETTSFRENGLVYTIHVTRVGALSSVDALAEKLELLAMKIYDIPATRGVSCTKTCARKKLRCVQDGFRIVNECPRLRNQFSCKVCETAAAGSSGPDMPCFVEPTAPLGYPRRYCMVSPDITASTCDAKHKYTRRLCPCVGIDNAVT